MKRHIAFIAALTAVVGMNTTVLAAGDGDGSDDATLEENLQTCGSCHGQDGNSSIAINPILAGQYESYLIRALMDYRSGARQSATMAGMAAGLSDREIRELAAYFSSQESDLSVLKR